MRITPAIALAGLLAAPAVAQDADLAAQIRTAEQLQQVAIAVPVLREHRQPGRRARPAVAAGRIMAGDRQQAADQRLDAGLGRALAELQRAEQVRAVGDRDRGHALAPAALEQRGQAHRALEQRVAGPDPEMDERGVAQPAAPMCGVPAS